jgi:cobalt-zinc-cadmium efflux system outer membrane protein
MSLRFVLACAISVWAGSTAAQTGPAVRSLEDALTLGAQHSPRIRAADARVGAAAGDRLQAGAWPNPEVFVDGENFGGSGDYRGTRSLELTAGLAQRIELGGKRQARIDVADAGLKLAEHERNSEILALREEIARAYIEALYAARVSAVESGRLNNARAIASAVRERVRYGREPPVQLGKSEIALASAQVAQQRAFREFQAAEALLAGKIGLPAVQLATDTAWLDRTEKEPEGAGDLALENNPDYARLAAATVQARAAVTRDEAEAVPDPTVRAGVRRFRETDSSAFLVGISIPLPVFDRNAGAIQRAQQELVRAEAEAEATRLSMRASFVRAREALRAAEREVEVMRSTILPAAEQALAAAQEGYEAGKFGFLDLLDAQRTAFDVNAQLAAALRDYHLSRIELMRLVGRTY